MLDFPFNHLDDVAFDLAFYELSHGPVHFSFNRLESLLFNPLSNGNIVTRDNKLCYIMSDFNLDLLNSDLHSITNDLVNV